MMYGYSDKAITVSELRKILEKIEKLSPNSYIYFGDSVNNMFTKKPVKRLATMIGYSEDTITFWFENEEGLIK